MNKHISYCKKSKYEKWSVFRRKYQCQLSPKCIIVV